MEVLLSGRRCHGVVMEVSDHSDLPPEKLIPLKKVHSLPPLPEDVLRMTAFVADYYRAEPGMATDLALPPLFDKNVAVLARDVLPLSPTKEGRAALSALREQKRASLVLRALIDRTLSEGLSIDAQQTATATQKRYIKTWRDNGWLTETPNELNVEGGAYPLFDEQQHVVDAVISSWGTFKTFLLQGITGSGKTEVYLSLARHAIAQGMQVLILLPEILLTPQFEQRIAAALPNVTLAVLHSALGHGDRLRSWYRAATGRAQLVLGTRLSVFTAMPNLGLIVVDEEHDPSFKQNDGVRYHARDVAIWRAKERNIPILLGSATPSLESYRHAQRHRYAHYRISRRAHEEAKLPAISLVTEDYYRLKEGLSTALMNAIKMRLLRGEQSLIFINRRGFSPSIKCTSCGWEATCPHCSVRLVLHRSPPSLRCHQCDYAVSVTRACPDCGNIDLIPKGFGTQRLEQTLKATFPEARIARIDRDSTRRKSAFRAIRTDVENRAIDILIGTQMLAKGHDFSMITLVGVLGADNALFCADFRATERLFALLHQVSGRAGRGNLEGEVMIQTAFPDHPMYQALKRHAFDDYAEILLAERKALSLPPYVPIAYLEAESEDEEALFAFLNRARQLGLEIIKNKGASQHFALPLEKNTPDDTTSLSPKNFQGVEIFYPMAATLAKRADFFRAQIMMRSGERAQLQSFLRLFSEALPDVKVRNVRYALNVDPM